MNKEKMRKRVLITYRILGAVLLILAFAGLSFIAWLTGEGLLGFVERLILLLVGSFAALFLGLRFIKFRFNGNDKS